MHEGQDLAVTLICRGRIVRIMIDEIVHVCKRGSEAVIYCKEDKCFHTRYSLQEILTELPAGKFFRLHKSHIVALDQLNFKFKDKMLVGNSWIPVTGHFRQQTKFMMAAILDRQYKEYKVVSYL